MNDCSEARTNQWLERYVEGSLAAEEAQKFEDHYFDCPACLANLNALQDLREELQRHPVPIEPARRVLTWPVLAGAIGAIAATFLIATFNSRIINIFEKRPEPAVAMVPRTPPAVPPSSGAKPGSANQEIAQLADLRLPFYTAPILRGEPQDAAFTEGMRLYAAGDCSRAIPQLAQVQGAGELAAKFYSGVCQMHLGDLSHAVKTLRNVAAAGDSPQQESALYYMAQISLEQNDAAAARRELTRVISLHGDLEQQAQKQMAELPPDSAHK